MIEMLGFVIRLIVMGAGVFLISLCWHLGKEVFEDGSRK